MSPPPPASLALSSDADLDLLSPVVVAANEARLRRQGFIAVVVASVCIGFSPVFIRLADVGPAAIGFWRLFFALGPTALWAYAEHRAARAKAYDPHVRVPLFTGRQLALALLAGTFFGADLVLFHAGLAHTTTANAVLLGNLAVVFVLLFGWLILGERPTAGLLVALTLALSGTGLIISRSLGAEGGGAGLMGDLLCVGAALAYASYMLAIRLVRRGGVNEPALGGGMVSLLANGAGIVVCLSWAIGTGEALIPASLQGLLAVAALGILGQAAGQGLATFALGRLPAGLISVVQLLQIVVGVSLAALLFGEIPSFLVIVGGLLVVAGVLTARPRRA